MATVPLHDRHRFTEALASFRRFELLDALWDDYLRHDASSSELQEARSLADDLGTVMAECERAAHDLQTWIDDHPDQVNDGATRVLSAPELPPEIADYLRKGLRQYGDGTSLAKHAFGLLEERLPSKRAALQEQLRRLEHGKSANADMTMGESCAMLIGIAIMGGCAGLFVIAVPAAITAGIVCGDISYFNGPTNGGGDEP
jgi:hypothetical protein